jgi:hypothetical protein
MVKRKMTRTSNGQKKNDKNKQRPKEKWQEQAMAEKSLHKHKQMVE